MSPTVSRAGGASRANIPSVAFVLDWLERHSSDATKKAMARYAIPSDHAIGVTMANMKVLARQLGKNHDLAGKLWDTGGYEVRTVAALVDEPEAVTAAQMERWAREFDNWAICDTVCFALFDRTPHAWSKVTKWSSSPKEYIRRGAFALLWGLTVHDKEAPDTRFIQGLKLIERAAADERHFVKKAVNMALRATGKRNAALNAAAITTARRLAESTEPGPRWIGKDALRELTSPSVVQRLRKTARRESR